MKTMKIQPSTLGQFFKQNVVCGYVISSLDYYNFNVYITFSQLRTEQFCHPGKMCTSPNTQDTCYEKFWNKKNNIRTSWKKWNYEVKNACTFRCMEKYCSDV